MEIDELRLYPEYDVIINSFSNNEREIALLNLVTQIEEKTDDIYPDYSNVME
jgi:hypothetical protein